MDIIEITNLTKYYGKSRGIIDLNLSVEQGEFFGFIGPNGAGKSTAIRILLGLVAPTSGSAKIFGKNITKEQSLYCKMSATCHQKPPFITVYALRKY